MVGGRRAEKGTRQKKGERELQKQLPNKRQHGTAQKLGLIGHRYLEKCKVGLDSVGYLQTERYYTLLIGSTGAPLIYQREYRLSEQGRQGEEEHESDGCRQTSEGEN